MTFYKLISLGCDSFVLDMHNRKSSGIGKNSLNTLVCKPIKLFSMVLISSYSYIYIHFLLYL